MSIYENGPKPKASRTKMPPQKADPQKITTKRDLSDLVKQLKNGPTSAKEILYDSDKNIVGILQRNDVPFFLDKPQTKELEKLLEE